MITIMIIIIFIIIISLFVMDTAREIAINH